MRPSLGPYAPTATKRVPFVAVGAHDSFLLCINFSKPKPSFVTLFRLGQCMRIGTTFLNAN